MRSLKLYEGWGTDLGTKLNRSLSAKVFLGVAGLLILCCLLIYGSILLFLPKSYTVVASQRVTEGIQQLTDTLSQTTYGEIGTVIETFCQEYQATVTVGNGTGSQSYGQAASNAKKEAMSTVTEISFADQTGPFLLTVTAPGLPWRGAYGSIQGSAALSAAADPPHCRVGRTAVQPSAGPAHSGPQPGRPGGWPTWT